VTRALGLIALVALLGAKAHAQPGVSLEPEERRTPFDQGRFGLSGGGGTTSAFGMRYYAVGLGATYFVLDGVGVGASTQVDWGTGPTMLRVSPELRYVAQPLVGRWPVIPYVAGYYTHWFVAERIDDVDAIGTRGGLLYISGSIILGLGIGYEHLVSDCAVDCSTLYPDFSIGFSF
jgi:hypothetical protein